MTIAIRRALEAHLAALTPAIATAYQNAKFTPAANTPYQRVFLLPARPDNSTMGNRFRIERGIFQVSLCYPTGAGTAAADHRADLLVEHFMRATTLTNGGINVLITDDPAKLPGMAEDDRWVIPVSIRYQACISR